MSNEYKIFKVKFSGIHNYGLEVTFSGSITEHVIMCIVIESMNRYIKDGVYNTVTVYDSNMNKLEDLTKATNTLIFNVQRCFESKYHELIESTLDY